MNTLKEYEEISKIIRDFETGVFEGDENEGMIVASSVLDRISVLPKSKQREELASRFDDLACKYIDFL